MADTGRDEAIEAACGAFYYEWGEEFVEPDDSATCRREMGRAIDAARPIIAAALLAEAIRRYDAAHEGPPGGARAILVTMASEASG